MTTGYQGEAYSYSDRATADLFPDRPRTGYRTFGEAFAALARGDVERLVVPIENSTTGSVLPVLDRLLPGNVHIVAEHLVEVRHAILAVPGSTLDDIHTVYSHPEALAQAEATIAARGWDPIPVHDTAGAVRMVAETGDRSAAALGPAWAGEAHGLVALASDAIDRSHNTTRFVVLAGGEATISADADKTSVAFLTGHRPGDLALALTELGLRGANLTRIESRPSEVAWRYRFFVDLTHQPGPEGVKAVFDPPLATIEDLRFLGSYRSAR